MFDRTEYDGPDHFLEPSDYQNALYVQDACNLSGVIASLGSVSDRLTDECHARGKGTEWRNRHPIMYLYSSAIAHLSGYASAAASMDRYSWATRYCRERASTTPVPAEPAAATPEPALA